MLFLDITIYTAERLWQESPSENSGHYRESDCKQGQPGTHDEPICRISTEPPWDASASESLFIEYLLIVALAFKVTQRKVTQHRMAQSEFWQIFEPVWRHIVKNSARKRKTHLGMDYLRRLFCMLYLWCCWGLPLTSEESTSRWTNWHKAGTGINA